MTPEERGQAVLGELSLNPLRTLHGAIVDLVKRHVSEAIAEERAACAKIADDFKDETGEDYAYALAERIRDTIRARR
jgi:hypothetical protein